MEPSIENKPTIRFSKNFIVEEHLDAVQWPQECAACGGPPEINDAIELSEDFKGFGKVKVDVTGIPYCQGCFPRIRSGKRLNTWVYVLSFVLGIPLAILFILSAMTNQSTTFVMCGFLILVGWAIGYGLAWLLVKLPAKIFFRKKFIEPVGAWMIKEQKKDKKEGISVVLSIPNKDYKAKFAALNGVTLPGG
jgi:hypothetical protein